MNEADAAAVATLHSSHSVQPAEQIQDRLRGELVRVDRWLSVATVDDVVVGYGRVSEHRPIQPEPREAPAGYYLGGLVVDPHHRRRGIGEALTRARMDWVYEVADEVWYFTSATNAASIAMHARLGFAEVTREFFFPGVTFTSGEGILFRATAQSRNGT